MPQYRVLKRSTRERIYVDKIDKRDHLHITGVEFTDSLMKQMQSSNAPGMFKESTPEPSTIPEPTVVTESVEAPAPEPVVEKPKKGKKTSK